MMNSKDDFDREAGALLPIFRMPTVFGPAPGPRNVPHAKQKHRYANHRQMISVSALTDADLLSKHLPPRCTLAGEPVINVLVSRLTELGWLAGRGYNIVSVRFPNVRYSGADGDVVAALGAVVWENLADPIITGRDEVAMPKIFADIPNPIRLGNSFACSASWGGFRFFELELRDALPAPHPATGERGRQFLYKHVPRTGGLTEADASYMTVSEKVPTEPTPVIHDYLEGTGSFKFNPARWEDLPTQYNVVNALARLPLFNFKTSFAIHTSQGDVDTTGGGIVSGQHAI